MTEKLNINDNLGLSTTNKRRLSMELHKKNVGEKRGRHEWAPSALQSAWFSERSQRNFSGELGRSLPGIAEQKALMRLVWSHCAQKDFSISAFCQGPTIVLLSQVLDGSSYRLVMIRFDKQLIPSPIWNRSSGIFSSSSAKGSITC